MNALKIPVNRSPNRPYLAGYYTALVLVLIVGGYASNWVMDHINQGFYPDLYLSLGAALAVVLVGAFSLQSLFFWWGLRRVPDPLGWVITFTGRSGFPHHWLFTTQAFNRERRSHVRQVLKERLPANPDSLPAGFSPPAVSVKKSGRAFSLNILIEALMVVLVLYIMNSFWLDPTVKILFLGIALLTAGSIVLKVYGFFRMGPLLTIDEAGIRIRQYEAKGNLREEQHLPWEEITQILAEVPASEIPALGIVANDKVVPLRFSSLMAEVDYTALYGAALLWKQSMENRQGSPESKEGGDTRI